MKWNLELHQGREAPCSVIQMLRIKLKQRSNTSLPFFYLVFFLVGRSFHGYFKGRGRGFHNYLYTIRVYGPKHIFLLQLSSLYLISYCFTRISSSVCSFHSVTFSYLVSVIPVLNRCFNFIHKIRITLQGTSPPWYNSKSF